MMAKIVVEAESNMGELPTGGAAIARLRSRKPSANPWPMPPKICRWAPSPLHRAGQYRPPDFEVPSHAAIYAFTQNAGCGATYQPVLGRAPGQMDQAISTDGMVRVAEQELLGERGVLKSGDGAGSGRRYASGFRLH